MLILIDNAMQKHWYYAVFQLSPAKFYAICKSTSNEPLPKWNKEKTRKMWHVLFFLMCMIKNINWRLAPNAEAQRSAGCSEFKHRDTVLILCSRLAISASAAFLVDSTHNMWISEFNFLQSDVIILYKGLIRQKSLQSKMEMILILLSACFVREKRN